MYCKFLGSISLGVIGGLSGGVLYMTVDDLLFNRYKYPRDVKDLKFSHIINWGFLTGMGIAFLSSYYDKPLLTLTSKDLTNNLDENVKSN
tara:strand:+ start:648 stop:917 length:270 start_codon:yes stop_codon:yes gene_type:complete